MRSILSQLQALPSCASFCELRLSFAGFSLRLRCRRDGKHIGGGADTRGRGHHNDGGRRGWRRRGLGAGWVSGRVLQHGAAGLEGGCRFGASEGRQTAGSIKTCRQLSRCKMAAATHVWGVAGNTAISGEVPLKQHHKGALTCALAAQRAAAWRRAARVHQARVGPSLAHAAVDVVCWALAHTLSARCRSGRGWRGRRRRRWGATAAAVNGRDAGRVGVAGALRLLALAAALDVAWSS